MAACTQCMEVCNEEAGRADGGKQELIVFAHLICELPGYEKQKEKGMLLPENVPCVHVMHIFELLNRWKPNSLVTGENV